VTQAPRSPASAARIVYIGLLASTIIISGGALAVSLSLGTVTSGTGSIDWIALVVGLGILGIVLQRRQRLEAQSAGGWADAWWQANSGAALVLWALLEFTSTIGSVVLFATGHIVVFVVLVFLALSGLLLLSPGRLHPD
jgi:hypothetical protein